MGQGVKAAVLAIDGGNSKTDVILIDDGGTVLSHVRGPGASPQNIGLHPSLESFNRMVHEAASKAGLATNKPFARHTAAYLAGADLPREEEILQREFGKLGWSDSTTVGNDTFALLRSGTSDGVGVAVVCGAGINCVGVARDGRVHRFPALGRISGDWGGGSQIGGDALWHAVRADDGRGPQTALLPALLAHFGVTNISEVVAGLHFEEISGDVVHELCPLLFRVAAEGDEVAAAVVERLIEEVVVLATVSLRRLDLLGEQVDIVLGGGVLTNAGPAMIGEITRRCHEVAPLADVHLVELPPVAGAALLGLDAIGASAEVESRLRSHYAPEAEERLVAG
ncbi:N-acetylglucosamine kinase [Kutzneria kofuensis]|uniref:N-acetylglucosamine kinase-like BadF-type ATPase n=1 Tax=Kutzneria kofuensis TaxID=103725 RepID=A0A7W9NHG3_9PSEU|nr:BadF/BadG/BcrA/BcrD ATPase family protein [Kutzneria kofuensis]MBB5892206.1 N-acetylglucosamine kinase-like BadF-type ATPase [Kutzneria kofuensis]